MLFSLTTGITLAELLVVPVLLDLIVRLALDDLHFDCRARQHVVERRAGQGAWRTARGSVRAVVTAAVAPEVDSVSPDFAAAVVSRLKILSGLDIAERRLPSDGSVKPVVRGREIDLRVTMTPTVEDPIENKIEGLSQIQVKPEIGLGFARAFRSVLHCAPNVIMIGEFRDPETAPIATQTSLAGHLVLAILHANRVAVAVTRLFDAGAESYLFASAKPQW